MTSLISQLNIGNPVKAQQVMYPQGAVPGSSSSEANISMSKITELMNLPTSNMLAQYVRHSQMVKNVDMTKPLERFEWQNDLRTMIQDNKAVIWAIVPRTFNAKDKDRNDLIEAGEQKGTFLNAIEGIATRINGLVIELFFNAKQLVVLRDTVTAAHRTGLNLTGIHANGQISNKAVFGFTRTVAHDHRVTGALSHFDSCQRFR